jgi:hypothetical protein
MAYDPKLIGALEPSQLTAATERPFPRRKLGWGILTLLMLLRAYVVIAVPVVCYAFIHALLTSP